MIEYSLVLPIYNQERAILKNLNSIIRNTIGNFELIVIFDACTDNSRPLVTEYLNKTFPSATLIVNDTPKFETTCDNIGFKLATGKYIIEIQSDMEIFTYGYNYLLTQPFRKYQDVISVSGRCIHNLFDFNTGIGKLGASIEHPLNQQFDQYNIFYVGDTCNRGPWALDREKLKQLDYLDEENFVLGDDDHDLNVRAKINYNWVCGYVPIEFRSILSEGSTRKPRDFQNQAYLSSRLQQSNGGILRKVYQKEIDFASTNIYRRPI